MNGTRDAEQHERHVTAERREHIARAIETVDEAVLSAPPEWKWSQEVAVGRALDVARASLQRWVEDLGYSLRRIADALETAPENVPDTESDEAAQAVEALAGGLVQIGAARDRLYAIAAQALGVPYLVPWRRGVRFLPDERAVRAKLNTLARESTRAGALKAQLDRLDGHAAWACRDRPPQRHRPRYPPVPPLSRNVLDEKSRTGRQRRRCRLFAQRDLPVPLARLGQCSSCDALDRRSENVRRGVRFAAASRNRPCRGHSGR
jgi:hypothetical protein